MCLVIMLMIEITSNNWNELENEAEKFLINKKIS